MPVKTIISDHKERMNKTIEVLHDELKVIRTGKASTGLVEHIKVDYYGTPTPLKQIAKLAAPQFDTIIIKPFDAGAANEIAKAIRNSDLSIAPVVEGKMIRLNIPPLSHERREQLAQQVKQMGEQAKVSIRSIRRDANKKLEKEEKGKVLTEDDLEKGKRQIDNVTREYADKIDSLVAAKAEEIMAG